MTKGFHTFAHYETKSIMFESNYAKYCLPVFKIHKDAGIPSMSRTEKIKDGEYPGFNQTSLWFSTQFLSFPSAHFRTPRCPDLSFNKQKTKYFVLLNE